MPHKGPHISISPDYVVNRILKINIDDFAEWPESVRNLAIAIAEELFLVAYNPFIDADTVRGSVRESFERESVSLAHYYATAIGEGITMFWSAYEAEAEFRDRLIDALRRVLPQIQSEGCPVLPCPAVTTDGDQRLAIEIERSVNVPLRKSAGVHQISEKRPRLFAGGAVVKAKAFQTLAVHRQRLLVDVTFQHQQPQYQLVNVLFLHLRELGNLPGAVHIHLQLLHGGIQLAEGRTGNQPGKQRKRADV